MELSPEYCAGGSKIRKADQIYAAARAVFMECGYAAASMDAVAARAGVSKATIYVHFEGKRALFEAVIRSFTEEMFEKLSMPETVTDLREALVVLGRTFLNLIMSPEAVTIHRIVIAEATQQPEIAEAFYAGGPGFVRGRVADFLFEMAQRGLLKLDRGKADLLAELFLSMLAGDCQLRAMLLRPDDLAHVEDSLQMAAEMVVARFG